LNGVGFNLKNFKREEGSSLRWFSFMPRGFFSKCFLFK
jgi:hypothetical protein